jgi:hypothetical protein
LGRDQYQCGTLLLYFLVVLTVIITLEVIANLKEPWVESLFIGLTYFLILVLPGLFVIRTHWPLGGIKWLRPVKSITIMVLTGFIFSSFYFDLELDRIINNELFYRKAKEEPISLEKVTASRNTFYESQESHYLYPVNTSTDHKNNLYGFWDYENNQVDISLLKDSLLFINNLEETSVHDISLYHFNSQSFAITHNHLDSMSTNRLWSFSEDTVNLIEEDSLRISTLSSMISIDEDVMLTGHNQQKHAAIYLIHSDSIELLMQLREPETNIDFMMQTSAHTLFTVNSTTDKKNLNSIFVNKINLNNKSVEKSIQLFENRVTNVPAYYEWNNANRKIYNPWIGMNADSSMIYVCYQLMTEKTFELQLFKLDLNLKILEKNYFRPQGNLSYFYAYTINQHSLYVFGRRFLLVPSSPFGKEKKFPFMTKFGVDDLKPLETIYLEKQDSHNDGSLEYQLFMYDAKLKVDTDSIYIFWSHPDRIEEIRLKKIVIISSKLY